MTEFCLKHLWKLMEFGEKVFRYDEDGLFILTSMDDNFCKMLGYGREELMIQCHNRSKDLVYPPDLPKLYDHVMKELAEKGEYTARYRMRRRDGELIWVWESGVMEYDLSGNRCVHNLVVNISDIENMRKDRDITYDNLPGGVLRMLISENNFYIMEFNQQYLDMMGTTPDEYMGSSGLYTFPEDITSLKDHVTLQAENREPIDFEFRCRCGEEREVHWFRLIGRFYDEADDGCEYLCIMIDITKRRQSVRQLEKERTRYQMAMRLSSDVLFEYDAKEHQFKIYYDTESSYSLPMQDGKFQDLDAIFFREELLHPDDFEKLHHYLDFGAEYSVHVRLLAEDKKGGGKYYKNFEIGISKTWKNGELRYVVGCIRDTKEGEREQAVHWRLRNILELQSGRLYEKILCVDTETGEVQIFISERMNFREYNPGCHYDEYIKEMAEVKVHPEERERFLGLMSLSNMRQVLQSAQLEEVLFFRIRHEEKEEYRYKCVRYSYLGEDARTIFINLQDVHRIREEQLKIEDANRKILASALNEGQVTMEMRRNFAAVLARELQDPLIFVEEQFRKWRREDESAEDVRDAISYMRKVINNIAQYEKLERGKIRFENKLFDLGRVLGDAFLAWKERLAESEIRIVYRMDISWKYYYGDSAHLIQCLNHVMGNSVLASGGKGTIDIWGNAEDQGNGISHFHLVVEDTGLPVNENFFGREYPVDKIEKQSAWKNGYDHMGTSFSLIVARKMVELLGGSIRLKRKEDQRNMIEITIPLQKSHNFREKTRPILAEEDSREDKVDLSRYSLLVLGDTQFIGPKLRVKNAQVDTAASGKEGIQRWRGYSPHYFDAIIVEEELSDMDYLGFTEMLRSQETEDAKTIPILAVTDSVGQQRMQEGMCRGVNAVIGRTMDFGRLKQMLDILVKEKKRR